MIITLTLNPAVDQTIFVDRLEVGDINRFRESHLDPAGKGINVSRVAHRLKWPTIAFGFLATDGAPLLQGAGATPYLIKPNVAEAERLLRHSLPNLEAVVQGAKELASQGIAVVVISMGAQGAYCAHDGRIWQATPPKVPRRSTVGSGDSLVAGLAVALAREDDIVEGLRLGTAAGAATAMSPGTALGTPEEVAALLPRVQIEELT